MFDFGIAEGQYAVTQEISNILRAILETDEKHENWRRMIGSELKTQLLRVNELSLAELDVIFSIISGGEYASIQAGSNAITKNKQLITIVGFSSKWDNPQQISSKENDFFKDMKLSVYPQSADDKVVGLFYDPAAKERQELIKLNLYEANPINDLDTENLEKAAKMSLINDIEVVKSFINILNLSYEPSTTSEKKILMREMKLRILKSITFMITQGGEQFLKSLSQDGLLDQLVHLLYQQISKQGSSKSLLPIDWLEMRVSQIKRTALENDLTLVPNTSETTAHILNNKQIILNSSDAETGEGSILNAYLASAINIHTMAGGQSFKCHLEKDILTFSDALDKPQAATKTLIKQYGLVFYNGQELLKLDNKAINILLHSQVVVTTTDVQPKEFFTKLVDLVKKDDEKEEKLRSLNGLLESVVLFIRQQDYERIQKPLTLILKPKIDSAPTIVEGLIMELEQWTGLDKDLLIYHMADCKNVPLGKLGQKTVKMIKEMQEEKQKNQGKLKKLEVDKKTKEIEAFKQKVQENEEKKNKLIQEKLVEIKKTGFGTNENKTLLEKIIELAIEKETQEAFDKELDELNILSDTKFKDKLEKVFEEKIAKYQDDKVDDTVKEKADASQNKNFFQSVLLIDKNNLHRDFEQTLTNLDSMYSRRTLFNILQFADLEALLKILLKDSQAKQIFTCFIKSSYNEALNLFITSGSKIQLQSVEEIITKIFTFCVNDPQHTQYLREFLRFQIIEGGTKTVRSIQEKGVKTITEYFNSQQRVLEDQDPFFLKFIMSLYLKHCSDLLLEKSSYINHIFTILLSMIALLQNDKTSIVNQLYGSLLQLLNFVETHLEESTRNGTTAKLLSNQLFKMIMQSIDYDGESTKYSNQQKLVLEVHMKLLDIHSKILDKQLGLIDTIYENSAGILTVKRGKLALQEKDKFDFMKYFIHYQNLEDHQKELINVNVETNHYAYDAKVLAKFKIKQVESLMIKVNDRTNIKDFTFLGVSLNAAGTDIDTYSQEELKGSNKEIPIYKGEFYMFYPIVKQMVISFGEGAQDRLGVGSSNNAGPKAAYSTKEMKCQKIFTSHTHSVVIDSENEAFRCGTIKRSGSTQSTFTSLNNNGKVRLVACGKTSIVMVFEDNSIHRQGFSKDGALGIDSDYASLKRFEKVDDEEQITDKIIDVSSGTHFTLFVTENGKLYGIGNRFLKELGLDCDNKIIPIPIKEGVKVLRAYASMGKKAPLAIIKVQLENGEEQFQSAGRSEQGLLGQGALIKLSKTFKPIKYDNASIKYVDFALHSDHAMAIDKNGSLYAWGSNMSKRSGFKEEIFDGVYEPKKVQFLEKECLKAIQVKVGFDHSLVLMQDDQGLKKLYSIGQDETNFNHLGITAIEAEDKAIYYREVTAFRGFEIANFAAGQRTSFVIIKGEQKAQDGLYSHKIGDQTHQGLLYFYKNELNQLVQMSETEYQTKQVDLPDICLVSKCPIYDLNKIDLPNLIELSAQVIDKDNTDGIHKGINCGVTQDEIKGIRYCTQTIINGDDFEVSLSEKGINQPNIYDINPIIYYRLRKPLKDGAKLPSIDLKNYFQESASYGLDLTIQPNLEFARNDQLLVETKSIYDELCDLISKFLPAFDPELLKEMDRYAKSNLTEKDIKTLKVKDDIKIADMNFKNPKLKKLSENVKRKRMELYLSFNQMFLDLMPFISLDDKLSTGDMTKQFMSVKHMILFSMKNKALSSQIANLPTGNQGYAEIRRRKAQRFTEKGDCDHKGEHTIFGQIFQQIKKVGYECFRQNGTDSKTWNTKFLGEGSIDAGGPFREAITNMCDEIESENLPLLIKTVNNRNNHGENRDTFIPNPASNNPTHLEMFKFLGCLIGFAIRTFAPLPLHFPPVFWKHVINDTPTIQDLKGFDTYSWQIVEDLKKQSLKLSDKEFNTVVEEFFVTRLSNGTEVELKTGGKSLRVTKENLKEYTELLLEKRFAEYQSQIEIIREGIDFVIPIEMLKLFTWEEVEIRACGDKVLDVEKLKKITEYQCCNAENEFIQRFWRVLADLTEEEQQLYLKFVWGRSRLPYDTEKLRDKHCLYLVKDRSDKDFPEAHTCFFQLDIPAYTTDEICKKRMVTAITMCGEIDADNSAQYIPDDDDHE